MHLVLLTNTIIVDVDEIMEAEFVPADGDDAASLTIYYRDKRETTLHDDNAVTAWHRLRDFCEPQGGEA